MCACMFVEEAEEDDDDDEDDDQQAAVDGIDGHEIRAVVDGVESHKEEEGLYWLVCVKLVSLLV